MWLSSMFEDLVVVVFKVFTGRKEDSLVILTCVDKTKMQQWAFKILKLSYVWFYGEKKATPILAIVLHEHWLG